MGQATLSQLPIRSARILRFEQQSGFWKPKPFLISKWPLFQRRLGGRVALVTELENGNQIMVVYDLHLESRGDDDLRVELINEVLADATFQERKSLQFKQLSRSHRDLPYGNAGAPATMTTPNLALVLGI